jgi:peptidoglycan/xylan/chitin deacetylase (PgdA/CDA1 family)
MRAGHARRSPDTLNAMARRPLALLVAALVLAAACGGGARPAATPAPTASATLAATATLTSISPPPATPTVPPAATATVPTGDAAQVVSNGDFRRHFVALTFDAGSDTGYTAQIVDTLAANEITAGFGITGEWAERNPELLRRIVADGHELINHSYNHASFTGLSTALTPLTREQRWAQLDGAEDAVQRIAGVTTKPYFRPPFGDYDQSVAEDVGARGYTYMIMWTVDSRGWQGISADEIVQRCLDLVQQGAIYIFHVGAASQDAAALQRVIDGLRDRGYGFATVSELIGR